ncbi:MAG: cell wall-active antibiotics response protein [Lachnospiraceae bacterium]|nr:cell wall-active antibiotics response protein [Lachnospiraceae bacterium]
MRNRKSSFIWGTIFIAAGILYILDEFTGLNIDIFDFWPLLFILPSIASMLSNGIKIGNSIFFLIGVTCLLTELNIVSEHTIDKLFIPLCLIIIGIVIMFQNKLTKAKPPIWLEKKFDSSKSPVYNAIFSSNKVMYPHDTFTGADISCVFGSVVLNLRDAIVTEDTIINCYCIFGGIDIHIPSNVNLKISGTPIFGGITNKTPDYENVNAPSLYINAITMFGGINLK